MNRFVVAVLVIGLSSPAFADIRQTGTQEAIVASQQARELAQARSTAAGQSNRNPYLIPSAILMGAGGLVTIYGLTHDTGVACSSNAALTSVSCGTTKSKATIVTGLAIVGAGAYVFHQGKRKSSPQIVMGPSVIGVRQRLAW